MGRRGHGQDVQSLAHEAARLVCEDAITDLRVARRKAAERLGIELRNAPGDLTPIEHAVIEWQRLFGGEAYLQRLRLLRQTAVKAMRLLAAFEPRLVGAVVSGAIGDAHRVQLHVFADKPEQLDIFLDDRGIPYEVDEREFRYGDGGSSLEPLLRFEAGEVGVDLVAFPVEALRHPPLSPVNGQAVRRLTLAQAEALLAATPAVPD